MIVSRRFLSSFCLSSLSFFLFCLSSLSFSLLCLSSPFLFFPSILYLLTLSSLLSLNSLPPVSPLSSVHLLSLSLSLAELTDTVPAGCELIVGVYSLSGEMDRVREVVPVSSVAPPSLTISWMKNKGYRVQRFQIEGFVKIPIIKILLLTSFQISQRG